MKSARPLSTKIHDNLGEYIDMMETWGDRIYTVGIQGYREQPYTYSDMRKYILGFSAEMKQRSIGRGDRVIIQGRASPAWVVAYFAVIHRGAVVIPLDPGATPEFVKHVIDKTEPALVLKNLRMHDIPEYSAGRSIPAEKVDRKELAAIVFTSGTTSNPKGVMLSHQNILSNLEPIENGLRTKKLLVRIFTPLRLLCTVPFSHMFGQVTGIFLPLILGSSVYFTEDTSPAALVRKIRRDRILALITVPRIMKMMMEYVKTELATMGRLLRFERRWERYQNLFYPLRVPVFLDIHRMLGLHFWAFIVGGAPLDFETHEFWRRIVYAVFQGYGLTETAPIVSMFNPFKHNRKSVGELFPGREVRIGPDGEILVRGQNVMHGYFDEPSETASVLEDGWLKTGDIGEIDDNGQLYIKGRKKDIIVTSDGKNVYPEDVENVLNEIAGVRESVVVGKPGPDGETVHAVLIMESSADPESAVRQANSRLLPFQRIKSFSIWQHADFPRTSTMKVKKNLVRNAILSKEPTVSTKGDQNILDGIIPGSADKNARLVQDLGLDSLDLVEVVCRVEKKYGVSLDESIIGPETTIHDLETIAEKPQYQAHLSMPRWTRKRYASLLRRFVLDCIILPAFRIPCRLSVQGRENIGAIRGPCIVCANHTSDLDPLAVLLALPRHYRRRISPAMGLNRFYAYFSHLSTAPKDEIKPNSDETSKRKRPFKRILHHILYTLVTLVFNTFPFPQTTAYRPSLEYAGELLDAGFWILLFPEGGVSPTGEMGKFMGGVSLLAERTGTPVLPVCITGMHELLPPGRFFPKKAKVYISFGKQMHYCDDSESFTTAVEEAVRRLCIQNS